LVIRAVGEPAPQGSFFAVIVKGRPQVVADSKLTKPWRAAVVEAAAGAMRADGAWLMLTGPTAVEIVFWLARPRSVRRLLPSVRPDVDKLARSTLDALVTAEVIGDDALIVDLTARKRYASAGQAAGARIVVTCMDGALL
jgi:Holliday junction resolvase RusA-like endonuclease